MSTVAGNDPKTRCTIAKTLVLDHVPGAILAIACHDDQKGSSAGFFFHCESEDGSKSFQFNVIEGKSGCKVFAGDNLASAPNGWTNNAFDDSSWQRPERNKGSSPESGHGFLNV